MESHTLILTPWMSAHRIVPWERSAFLYVHGRQPDDRRPVKIEVLETYDEVIRTPRMEFNLPAVARLTKPVAAYKKGVKFSRINIMTRDSFTCQYCGRKLPMRELNYDHVVPRIQGGQTVWENIVTSCYPCNDRKAGRTPEQAGMKLRRKPFRPKTLPMSTPLWPLDRVPVLWVPYLDPASVYGGQAQGTG
jgi:5-methylcytosine-specific restriction endonuclease McrA